MDLIQLGYFTTTVEVGNFTRAAQTLHITQPALSKSIARLEQEVGGALFHRNGKRVSVNSYGQEMYRWAVQTLAGYENIRRRIHSARTEQDRTITIGFSGPIFTRKLVMGFQKRFPEYRINSFQIDRREYPKVLYRPDVDCVLVLGGDKQPAEDYLHCIQVAHAPLYAVLPWDHPLAGWQELSIHEVGNERWLFCSSNYMFRGLQESIFRQAGIEPQISASLEMSHVFHMLENGLGCSILSVSGIEELHAGDSPAYRCIPLREDFCMMDIYLVYDERKCRDIVRTFLEYAAEEWGAEPGVSPMFTQKGPHLMQDAALSASQENPSVRNRIPSWQSRRQ